jgi:hypothetical protein
VSTIGGIFRSFGASAVIIAGSREVVYAFGVERMVDAAEG